MPLVNESGAAVPFILRLARPQRGSAAGYDFRYDSATDELLIFRDGRWVFAADQRDGGLGTKKMDIETGEDDKGE